MTPSDCEETHKRLEVILRVPIVVYCYVPGIGSTVYCVSDVVCLVLGTLKGLHSQARNSTRQNPPPPPPPPPRKEQTKKRSSVRVRRRRCRTQFPPPGRPRLPFRTRTHTQHARTYAGVSFTGAPVGRFSLRRARSLGSAWPISWTACLTADSALTAARGRRQGPAAPLRWRRRSRGSMAAPPAVA